MSRLLSRVEKQKEFAPCLPGFEGINRYFDKAAGTVVAKILPGEYYVTVRDENVATVLGSCVSACIRDRIFGVGGMNHFMLPSNGDQQGVGRGVDLSASARYGNFAMEHMINDILKHGASRKNLEAKIVGGGRILQNMTNIGKRNIEFVREYLQAEGITLIGEDVGDVYPRKVLYDPKRGIVRVKKLESVRNDTLIERETRYRDTLSVQPVAGDVELF
jgi:chemotaxis protein CheD